MIVLGRYEVVHNDINFIISDKNRSPFSIIFNAISTKYLPIVVILTTYTVFRYPQIHQSIQLITKTKERLWLREKWTFYFWHSRWKKKWLMKCKMKYGYEIIELINTFIGSFFQSIHAKWTKFRMFKHYTQHISERLFAMRVLFFFLKPFLCVWGGFILKWLKKFNWNDIICVHVLFMFNNNPHQGSSYYFNGYIF